MQATSSSNRPAEAVTVKPVSISTFAKALAALVLFLSLMRFVGRSEYTDQVYYSIPDIAFEEITLKLGDGADREAIVSEYENNLSYYKSLN